MEYISSECMSRSVGSGNQLVSTLITALLSIHCSISDPGMWPEDYGAKLTEGQALDSYDYVVIGGGTSGSVVASRLSENPDNKVLVIEAGGVPPVESEIPGLAFKMIGTDGDWQYPTQSNQLSCMAMKNESCVWHRGKMLGGSSSMDAMLYSQGLSRDYEWWENKGNAMWSWRDVLPYFKKLENFRGQTKGDTHGTSGPINIEAFWSPKYDQNLILEAARELKHEEVTDFVDKSHIGFGWLYGMVKDGWRVSSAKAYLGGDKAARSNIQLVTNALATKIHFRKDRTEKVSFVYQEKEYEVKIKKELILAAGPIETPKLLMLSGVGPRTQLKSFDIPLVKDLQVGDNLQDHIRVDLFFRFDYKYTTKPSVRELDAIYYQLVHNFGSFGAPTLDVGGFLNTRNSSRFPDTQIAFIPITNMDEFAANFKSSILRSLKRQIRDSDHVITFSVILLRPKSSGHVRLQSNDYRVKPLIIPNSFQKDADVEVLVRAIKEVMRFEDTETFSKYRAKFIKINIPECNEQKYRSVKYWECYIKYMSNTFYQPAGTAKMGPASDVTAVVDDELRVHGLRRLRVVDASIMPTMVSGPISAPTIMIGERGADFILESQKKS